MWLLGPILVLVIAGQGVQSQSVEQLLAQAKATESIENLLADAVVEKSDSSDVPEENLVKLMRSKAPEAVVTSTTARSPISSRRRQLFRPRQ